MPSAKSRASMTELELALNVIEEHFKQLSKGMDVRTPFGLHSGEAAERLTTLLAMHLMLDREVTALLSLQLIAPRMSRSLEKTEEAVSRVTFDNRVRMAHAACLISDSCAADIKAVNSVRNKFAHCHPKGTKGSKGMVPEISSKKNFEDCMERGRRALNELKEALIVHRTTTQFCPTVP